MALCYLGGCSETGDPEVELLPDNGLFYSLYPNDQANNDSASANLAHGVSLVVHPRASYKLSFEIDPRFEAPKVQLFRLYTSRDNRSYKASKVRSLKAKVNNGRYEYDFNCEENEMSLWAATVVQDGHFFEGSTAHVKLTGEGAYSDHLSLNLIVVGNVDQKLEGFTLQELADQLLLRFRKYYTSIIIDTLYVSYAKDHPTLGKKYPGNEPWIAGKSSDDTMVSELGGWPGIFNALDLVLVNSIEATGILGYSNLFSGNLGGGESSTVVLGAYYQTPSLSQEPVSMNGIVETAIHETGHFFGLRHTTATLADLQRLSGEIDYGDYSNLEDGIEDTLYCPQLQRKNLMKTQGNVATDIYGTPFLYRVKALAKTTAESCPDAGNLMFPLEVGSAYDGFSDEQLAIIRSSLMIFPH